jgi:hypothetical protein
MGPNMLQNLLDMWTNVNPTSDGHIGGHGVSNVRMTLGAQNDARLISGTDVDLAMGTGVNQGTAQGQTKTGV